MAPSEKYATVRSLSRGIALLQELNRLGHAKPAVLSSATKIDRTTTYRLLATLQELGLVAQNVSTDEYILTSAVRTLSEGFTSRDRLTRVVAQELGVLFKKVLWPTDFATFERGAMVIRETTHRFSPYSIHRAMVGQPRPLLNSALGRAALAGASKAERTDMLRIAAGSGALQFAPKQTINDLVAKIVEEFKTRGYAYSVGGTEKRMSAIALPVHSGRAVVGAINLVFFRGAMSIETAAEQYLADLRHCIASVEETLSRDE
jgi:IclR family mhp operon transcriptional activator